jgi:hypothetical protein
VEADLPRVGVWCAILGSARGQDGRGYRTSDFEIDKQGLRRCTESGATRDVQTVKIALLCATACMLLRRVFVVKASDGSS